MVSRCFPGGYNVKLYISRGRLAWWLLAFFCAVLAVHTNKANFHGLSINPYVNTTRDKQAQQILHSLLMENPSESRLMQFIGMYGYTHCMTDASEANKHIH